MTIIKIAPNGNGSHDNQTINGSAPEAFPVPEGWAVIPSSVGTHMTLENFPFGEITVAEADGVATVTDWTPLPVPEPEEPVEPETGYTAEDAVKALIGG